MTRIERHIVKIYSSLFNGFSKDTKLELIGNLSESLKSEQKPKDEEFYKLFGALASDEDFGKAFSDLKLTRKFRKKEIQL